ncbi:MAG: hypothetical protein HY553_16530 [Elusimicrobia bacterium]|nr:hypothetical protein [Elusimicrobiota bacterium]
MKRVLPAVLIAASACAVGPRLSFSPAPKMDRACPGLASATAESIKTVAVLDFADSVNRRTDVYHPPSGAGLPPRPIYVYLPRDGALAADALETAVVAAGRLGVVDRRTLAKTLEEQKLQLTGLVDPRQAVRIGRLLGADAVLTGAVDEAYAGYENHTIGGDWIGTYLGHVGISLRLTQVESGQLIWSCQLARNTLNYLSQPLTLTPAKP